MPDCEVQPSIDPAQIRELATCRRVDYDEVVNRQRGQSVGCCGILKSHTGTMYRRDGFSRESLIRYDDH